MLFQAAKASFLDRGERELTCTAKKEPRDKRETTMRPLEMYTSTLRPTLSITALATKVASKLTMPTMTVDRWPLMVEPDILKMLTV